MAKKIKEIKRIKKKSLSKKYYFDDDSSNYSIKSTLRKLTILVVLIVAFIATQMVLILPINDKAAKLGPDLIEKNAAIENGKKMQKGLLDKEKKARSALNNLKISFFKTNEGEPFYQFLSNIAIKNRLTISSIKKIDAGKFNEKKQSKGKKKKSEKKSEKKSKKSASSSKYQQISYELQFQGRFIDYINFIKDIQYADKSLSTNDVIIEKVDENKINISSVLTINLMKI